MDGYKDYKKQLKRKEQKLAKANEQTEKLDNAKTFLLLNYQGLTVSELAELRNSLREVNSDIKVYKNTLMNIEGNELWDKSNEYERFYDKVKNNYTKKYILGAE